MSCKLSFVLAILAFFMLAVSALPIAVDAGTPGSLMGRTYARREAVVVASRAPVAADAPVELVARDEPLAAPKRLHRRSSPAIARRAPEPAPAEALKIMHLVAARSNMNSLH